MDPLQLDFAKDLDQVSALLDVVDQLMDSLHTDSPSPNDATQATRTPPPGDSTPTAPPLHSSSGAALPILVGTLQLYICGRFEYFVKARFQDMCDAIASRCGCYPNLPREMRDSLVRQTAEAMLDRSKLGYIESDIKSFVLTMAENLGPSESTREVNSQCLAASTQNMRAEVLAELFKRGGATDLWDQLSGQAKLRAHFESSDRQAVKKLAQTRLDEFITSRNAIAHPSSTVTCRAPANSAKA